MAMSITKCMGDGSIYWRTNLLGKDLDKIYLGATITYISETGAEESYNGPESK